jgi:hypothetical protein
MKYSNIQFFTIVLTCMLALSACDTSRKALGLERNNPNEFAVVTHHPLTFPPNGLALPTPTPGVQKIDERHPQMAARSAILGKSTIEKSKPASKGEVTLLAKAGAENRHDNIRTLVDEEARVASKKEESFIRDLLDINKKPGKVINPVEENKKLNGKEMPSDIS